MSRVYAWLDERVELGALWQALFLRHIPLGVGLRYTLGFAALFLLINQAVTGMVLAMYYSPSPDHAYDSIQYITNEVVLGSVVRGLHHWGGNALVVVVLLHMGVVFLMGAYKYPREVTWFVGVVLLLIVMGFGFTGYLLPWDQKAYWATTVGTNMAGTIPYFGGALLKVVRGSAEVGAMTLTRFYAFHVLVFPALAVLFVGIHLYLVVKQGVSVPPGLWEAETQESLPFDQYSVPEEQRARR